MKREREREGEREKEIERETVVCERMCVWYLCKCVSDSLMGMGGDLCSEGRGFESQHRILDRHSSH